MRCGIQAPVRRRRQILQAIPASAPVLLHFDVDVLRKQDMPASYFPHADGLTLSEGMELLGTLLGDPGSGSSRWPSTLLCEILTNFMSASSSICSLGAEIVRFGPPIRSLLLHVTAPWMVSVNHNFVSKTKSVDNISIYATMPGNSQVALLARFYSILRCQFPQILPWTADFEMASTKELQLQVAPKAAKPIENILMVK